MMRSHRRRRALLAALAAVLVLAAAAGLGIWWFFRDDAPDAVTLDAATATVDSTIGEGAATPAEARRGIEGSWAVDTTVGTFSFEDSTGTFAGFRVQERLSGIGETTAVGRTPAVSGTITIEGSTLTAATIAADMTAITTNDGRRNNAVQRALETSTFPAATFTLTEPIDLGADAGGGEPIAVVATGELTIHGVTTPAELPLEAQLVGGKIVVVGSIEVSFADYGVDLPDAPIVLSAEDHGIVEFQLYFTPA